MFRIVLAGLAIAGLSISASAQADSTADKRPILSLDEALSMASQNAPTLDLLEAERLSANTARQLASLRPNPSLSIEAENIAGNGVYRDAKRIETTATIALPLELGGKRTARINVADAQSQKVSLQAAIIRADTILSAKQAYAEASAAEQRLTTLHEQARIAKDALQAAQLRVQTGRASPIEIQRAEVAHTNAQTAIERGQRLAHVTRLILSSLIGQPAIESRLDTAWFTAIPIIAGPQKAIAVDKTLAMATAAAELSIADASIKLARAQRVPDLTIGTGARYVRETRDTAALISVSVALPFFNNGKAAVEQATTARLSVEARNRLAMVELKRAILRAQADLANAATSAKSAQGPALSAAQETARIARIGYREGKFSQLELLDAERTLADTQLAAIDALLNYHNATAQLERLSVRAPDRQEIKP